MARRSENTRPTVRSEGGLLPPDVLDRIVDPRERELPGLDPVKDYGLERNVRLTEAAARSWEHAKAYWGAFQARLEDARPGTELGITRQQWLVPLLDELGFDDLTFRPQAERAGDREFAISHRASAAADAPPVHLVSWTQPLDRSDPTSTGGKASPHSLLQSYLNETDHLWGIVTNGRQLRLLRDNASLTRPAYLEFDLEGMMEGGVFSDFTLLWMVAHHTRFAAGTADTSSCFLEQWSNAAMVRGARALHDLRYGVEGAIKALGQGFIDHPENQALRAKLSSGELNSADYYRQLLRMVYRLLFLLVVEARDEGMPLLFPAGAPARGRSVYYELYAVSRLWNRLRRERGDDRYDDLWRAQRVAFDLLRHGNAAIGLPALGGGIFDARMCPDLEDAQLWNEALKDAVRGLAFAATKTGYRRINYRDLDVEELGSVYESLLDEQPVLRADGLHLEFTLASGGERKSSGSYYTPSVLVQELIRSALVPVIEQALASATDIEGKRRALLDLAVCDPACGSGHFLLAAARRIGEELARLAGDEHDINVLRHHTREAITHCVYGVDLNPLAVDLCRLALWLEGHEAGKPLGFLDHRIRLGNSLVGATAALLEQGIPSEAFEPAEGDSKELARELKKRNRQELDKPQLQLFGSDLLEPAGPTAEDAREAEAIGDFEEDAPDDVTLKEAEYQKFESRLAHRKRSADLWTAAFYWPLRRDAPAPPTQATLFAHRTGQPLALGVGERELKRIVAEIRPFHWELEFPEVFATKSGFSCMLGNPPWVSYTGRQRAVVSDRFLKVLLVRYPCIARWPASHAAFVLLNVQLLADGGRAGVVLPRQVADLPAYGSVRERVTEIGRVSSPVVDAGEDAFIGVTQPVGLFTIAANRRGGYGTQAPWLIARNGSKAVVSADEPGPSASMAQLSSMLATWPRFAPKTFGDPGVHTGNVSKKIVVGRPTVENPDLQPVREGRDIAAFTCGQPRRWLWTAPTLEAGEYCTIRPVERYRSVPILVRQTADRPIAARHTRPTFFRNSLLACYGQAGVPDTVVMAFLNSALYAWLHREAARDSDQKAFPQVKVRHLQSLPAVPLREHEEASGDRSPWEDIDAAVREAEAAATLESHPPLDLLERIERLVLTSFQLPTDLAPILLEAAK